MEANEYDAYSVKKKNAAVDVNFAVPAMLL